MPDNAKLTYEGREYELPIVEGTEKERAIDIASLRSETGLITLDPGFGNTGSCKSAITFIDGEKGILRYRGIPLEDFEKGPNFVEVAWLLIFGRLPNSSEYTTFSQELTVHSNIDEDMKHHFTGFPRSAPPMAVLSAMITTLSCFYPEISELDDAEHFEQSVARLLSNERRNGSRRRGRGRGSLHSLP